MNVEMKISDQILRQMIVTVDSDTYKKDIRRAQRKFARSVEINGFRKGKVPIDVVLRKYDNEIKSFYLNEFGNEYFKFGINECQAIPISQPSFIDSNFNEDGEAFFIYEFESYPEGYEYEYKDLEVKFIPLEYTEDKLEKTIKDLLKKNAEEIPLDETKTIDLGDIVTLFCITNQKEIKRLNVLSKNLEEHELQEDDLIGLKINDTFSVEEKEYRIEDAYQVVLPDLNDDTAKLFGYDDVEKMRESLKEKILEELEEKNKNYLTNAIIESFSKQNKGKIKIPSNLILEAGYRMLQQYMVGQSSEIDKFPEDFVRSIGERQTPYIIWDLVYERVAKDHSISVDDDEIELEIKRIANLYHTTIEDLKSKHASIFNNVRHDILNRKVIDFIKPFCTIIEIEEDKTFEDDIGESEYEVLDK